MEIFSFKKREKNFMPRRGCVTPGKLNAGPDYLSRITNGEEPTNLEDNFPDAQLFLVQLADEYFSDIIQYLSTGITP
jgi:hypothetical protein